MKKIKLLTFSEENSYGAMLQCYALSRLLSEWGYEVTLIVVPLKKHDYGFIGNITYRIGAMFFDKFRKNKLPDMVHFENCRFEEDDIFIVGSDQVWNPDITRETVFNYFFDFLPDNSKRISYAASFGISEWTRMDIRGKVGECLQKFSSISVREPSGSQICKGIFNLNAKVVLDPTLLLNSYEDLINRDITTKNTLIYFSLLKTSPKLQEAIRYMGKRTGNVPLMLGERRFHRGIRTRAWMTVESWVSQIASSSFVITNSFHCTVFAIIFKKQFVVIPGHPNRSGRIFNLLDSLGLSNRYYNNVEDFYSNEECLKPIDYDVLLEKLGPLRDESMTFLKNALNKGD